MVRCMSLAEIQVCASRRVTGHPPHKTLSRGLSPWGITEMGRKLPRICATRQASCDNAGMKLVHVALCLHKGKLMQKLASKQTANRGLIPDMQQDNTAHAQEDDSGVMFCLKNDSHFVLAAMAEVHNQEPRAALCWALLIAISALKTYRPQAAHATMWLNHGFLPFTQPSITPQGPGLCR